MKSSIELFRKAVRPRAPWNYQAMAALGRLYPFYSGSAQVAHSKLFANLAKPEESVAWCRGPGGSMLVPLDDYVGRCIYFTGDYDRKISWLCRRTIRCGDVVLDIGANMGVVSLLLARRVGPTGLVHAFEPNPSVARLLEQSALANGFTNLKLHSVALGSCPGSFELSIPRNNAGEGSFIYHKDQSDCDIIRVSVQSLSQVVREQGIRRIRFIKIDVEGFESEVLIGANEILKTVRPDLILFETNETMEVPFLQRPAVQILQSADYRFLALPKSLLSPKLVPIDAKQYYQAPSHDVLAVAADKYSTISAIL